MNYYIEYEFLDDEKNVFKPISYDELMYMLNNFQTGLVYIGGAWCKSCQAIVHNINKIAKEMGLDTVYNYDPKFINVFKDEEDLRDCKTLEIKLKYYEFVEKTGFKSNELVKDTLIPRIPVPSLFAIKNGKCEGYYSIELIKGKTMLHYKDDDVDRTSELENNIKNLINKLKINGAFI